MNFVFTKIKTKNAIIKVPSSKSYTIRALFCAFLSGLPCEVNNICRGEDVDATLKCLRKLGAKFALYKTKVKFFGFSKITNKKIVLNVKGSATLFRFIIPVVLIYYPNQDIYFYVDNNLLKRPLDGYQDLFEDNKIIFKQMNGYYVLNGEIAKQEIRVDGSKSSQFVSGLLLSLVNYHKPITLKIINLKESRNYVLMTLKMMEKFGVKLELNETIYFNNLNYLATNVEIEGDYANATLLMILALLSNRITLKGLNFNSLQGEQEVKKILCKAGASLKEKENELIIKKSSLNGLKVDLENCIDLGPCLMAYALNLKTPSRFYHYSRLKYKESNRLDVMLNIFKKIGAKYVLTDQYLEIIPSKIFFVGVLDSYNDHRIVMALIILSLINKGKIEISNFQAINKSFPNLPQLISKMGFRLKENSRPFVLTGVSVLDNFQIPSDGYVLGYEKFTSFAGKKFTFHEIQELSFKYNIFLQLNALVKQNEIQDLSIEIEKLSTLPISFIVQDIGMLNILLKKVSASRIIFNPYTLICNKLDANEFSSYGLLCVGLSNEITLNDLYQISLVCPSFLSIFSYAPMYQSYRQNIKLYKNYYSKSFLNNNLKIKERTRTENYPILENEHGTVIFRDYITNYLENIEYLENFKYVYLDSLFIKPTVLKNVAILLSNYFKNKLSLEEFKRKINNLGLNLQDGFMYQDSIYREKKL